jgi:hypothetical protein
MWTIIFEAVWKYLPSVLAFILTNGVFLPNELYLSNADEFPAGYKSFCIIMVVGSLLLICLIILAEYLLKKVGSFINLVLAAISIMSYLQYIFFNGKLENLNGDKQTWSMGMTVFNCAVWIFCVCIFVYLGCVKKRFANILRFACIYIILVQLISSVTLTLTTNHGGNGEQMALTTENSLEIAGDKNVLIFVLDRFDSEWMQELIDDDAEFVEPFDDFTFYNNATSLFTCTYVSVPYLLTGTEWNDQYRCGNDYLDVASENIGLMKSIHDKGFDLGIYTDVSYTSPSMDEYISNYNGESETKYKLLTTYLLMWRTSLYKTMPFLLKNTFVYYSDDINEMVDNTGVWNIENDYPFCESLFDEGLSVSEDYDSALRFYHMHGAHTPYILSSDLEYKTDDSIDLESQIRGCLKIVYEYIAQLKELGLYDSSTIIITADHGKGNVNTDTEITSTSSPIIMVKGANEKSNSLIINESPVTQAELISTIAKETGIDNSQYGKTLDQITMEDNTERYYIETYSDQFEPWTKYVISGNVHDITNWTCLKIGH